MRTGELITHKKHRWRKGGGRGGEDKINKYGRATTGRRRVRRRSGAEGGISSVEMRGTRM